MHIIENKHLGSDAKGGLTFLALNFLLKIVFHDFSMELPT